MHALLALAFGYFVIGTGAFVIGGLLNEIAGDLGTSVATAGQLISGYSLALALGAPLLAGLITRFERRTLIVAGLLLFGVLHFVAAAAPGYGSLVIERVLTGVAAAVVTPQSVAAAGSLVPPDRRGRAIGIMFLGFSLSIVAGVPLGTVLGATFGWRVALALIGAVAVGSALWIRFVLPAKLPAEAINKQAWRSLAGNAAILWVVATTVLHSAGQFTLYTYFAPAIRESLHADTKTIGLLFGWFGACGVAGNFVISRIIDRAGITRVVTTCLSLMVAAFLLWPLTVGSLAMTLFVTLLWGLGGFAIHPSQQARLVALAPALASASVALNLSGTYLGQAIGGGVGGTLLSWTGTSALSWAGLALILTSCGAALMASRTAYPRRSGDDQSIRSGGSSDLGRDARPGVRSAR
jgi:predicted MFS family arabinose efflux permease